MRWIELWRTLGVLLSLLSALDVAAEGLISPPKLASSYPSAVAAPDSRVKFNFGVRLGLTEGPRVRPWPEELTSMRRASFIGTQITAIHEDHFELGLGLEFVSTPSTRRHADTMFNGSGASRYTGSFLYLSPGVHTRAGKGQPLGFGANIDIGFVWVSGQVLADSFGFSYELTNRIRAVRPKGVITYELTPKITLQFEGGWLWAKHDEPMRLTRDDYGNLYWPSLNMDFTGPFASTMITIPWPSTVGYAERSGGPVKALPGQICVFSARLGLLPNSARSGPARWDFDGSYGPTFARGLELTIRTRNSLELGLGLDYLTTPSEVSSDTLTGGILHARGQFLFATLGHDGYRVPVMALPIGFAVDVGRLWSEEISAPHPDRYWRRNSTALDGWAARIKLTASPKVRPWLGLRVEAGWLFARLGSQLQLSPDEGSYYRTAWVDPTMIDFSGPSLMATIRFIAAELPSSKSHTN